MNRRFIVSFLIIVVVQVPVFSMKFPEIDSARVALRAQQSAIHQEAATFIALHDTLVSTTIQAGIGFHQNIVDRFESELNLSIGLFKLMSEWTPYAFISMKGYYSNEEVIDNSILKLIATLGVGGIGSTIESSIALACGFDYRYRIVKIGPSATEFFSIVMIAGYGFDFEQHINQGFVNIGVACDTWLSLTFDVGSFFYPSNAVLHMGRLQ